MTTGNYYFYISTFKQLPPVVTLVPKDFFDQHHKLSPDELPEGPVTQALRRAGCLLLFCHSWMFENSTRSLEEAQKQMLQIGLVRSIEFDAFMMTPPTPQKKLLTLTSLLKLHPEYGNLPIGVLNPETKEYDYLGHTLICRKTNVGDPLLPEVLVFEQQ